MEHFGPIMTVVEQHLVSAAEAAYSSLFCLICPRKQPLWIQSADWPTLDEQTAQEWDVQAFSVAMNNATGEEYQGRVMMLFAPLPKGQGIIELPSTRIYYMGQRVTLLRPVRVKYGLGLLMRTPSYVQTDEINLNFTYRVVHQSGEMR